MTKKGIIFDLDGVLLSTDRFHYLAWKALADKLEIPFTERDNEKLRGVSRMESLELVLANKPELCLTDAEKLAYYEKLVGELQADLLAMQSELFETKAEYEEIIAELEAEKNRDETPQTKDFTYTVSGNAVTITGYQGSSVRVEIPSVIDGKNVVAIGDRTFQNHKKKPSKSLKLIQAKRIIKTAKVLWIKLKTFLENKKCFRLKRKHFYL